MKPTHDPLEMTPRRDRLRHDATIARLLGTGMPPDDAERWADSVALDVLARRFARRLAGATGRPVEELARHVRDRWGETLDDVERGDADLD